MYEIMEHTADVGLRIRADSLDTLFADAARGLSSLIVANLDAVRPEQSVAFQVRGKVGPDLLFDWLSELLYTFEVKKIILNHFDVTVTDQGLRAEATGEQMDPDRHQLQQEVKAVTYHALSLEQTPHGYEATVIVDI